MDFKPKTKVFIIVIVMSYDYDDGAAYNSDSSQSFENDRPSLQSQISPAGHPTADAPSFLPYGSVVVHYDVDAFYCQCEELRDPTLSARPLAIGQKHIVVTCNYVARSRGVKKLMLRSEATKLCPSLVIVDGSDLAPYRRQARRIYKAFRRAVASLPGGTANLARKGGMDEMFADVSAAVGICQEDESAFSGDGNTSHHAFVYGDDASSTEVSISEDQSGATAHVSASSTCVRGREGDDRSGEAERQACAARLRVAAELAGRVRREVQRESGFRACAGVSTSPMLAKLASELRKPDSLNLLYPWRATAIVEAMPLRKVPGLGSRTLKSLQACLREHNDPHESPFWTCRDLLRVPRSDVTAICGFGQGELLLQRCRGLDPLKIEDDHGGLAKTVSVEDSYKRGSVTTINKAATKLEILCGRLPPLLDERRLDSDRRDLSYPRTIRLTIRLVDHNLVKQKRPFVTKSIQRTFEGRSLLVTSSGEDRCAVIRAATKPLLDHILLGNTALNVTKLNIAVTGFADVRLQSSPTGSGQRSVKHFFAADKRPDSANLKRTEVQREENLEHATSPKPQKLQKMHSRQKSSSESLERSHKETKVDPSFLAALPEDIRTEVERDMSQQVMSFNSAKKKVGRKIHSFFSKI